MRLSLVITTYDRPDALTAVLATVGRQVVAPDEVIVADDGSGDSTRDAIARFADTYAHPVRHVRQDHAGFRLTRLRNLATAHASGELLVFIDGDMLLDPHFVADHRRHARPGTWIQGVRVHLDPGATALVIAAPGTLPGFFSKGAGGLRRIYAVRSPSLARLMGRAANGLIAVKGCNQSYWRCDLVAVNGFNEEIIGWGPEDKELAARLETHGIERLTLLFGGIAWHLHHVPASRERREANTAVLERTRAARLTRCAQGLDAHL